jgi:hypothetical protein
MTNRKSDVDLLLELGPLVEMRWRKNDYSEELFPGIAAQALTETALHSRVDPWQVIRWLETVTQLPRQVDLEGNFGNPPITLYDGSRFHISVYFWVNGTTTIHQHAFAGAFQVLLGSSIHSRYTFKLDRAINAHFQTGQLTLEESDLLVTGDVREIIPGSRYIHSLFHLDRPSVSLIIRTHQSSSGLPQYNYLRPFISFDPFFKEPAMMRKKQAVELLLGIAHAETDSLISDFISSSDFQTTFVLLEKAYDYLCGKDLPNGQDPLKNSGRFHALIDKARERHGELVDLLLPVYEEQQRQHEIVKRRANVKSKDQRFFLALLLNVPQRKLLLKLVKQGFPERDPIHVMLDRVSELSTMPGPAGSNILGIKDFDDDYLFVYRCLLQDLTDQQIKQNLKSEYKPEDAIRIETRFDSLCSVLRNSNLLRSAL